MVWGMINLYSHVEINMILIYFRTGPLQVAIKAKTNVTRGHHPNHTTVPGPINSQHTHL